MVEGSVPVVGSGPIFISPFISVQTTFTIKLGIPIDNYGFRKITRLK